MSIFKLSSLLCVHKYNHAYTVMGAGFVCLGDLTYF